MYLILWEEVIGMFSVTWKLLFLKQTNKQTLLHKDLLANGFLAAGM